MNYYAYQVPMLSDRLYVCPNALSGQCNGYICGLVHPEPHVRRNVDRTVTVCRDFLRGNCNRDKCRYCHLLPQTQMMMAPLLVHSFSLLHPPLLMRPILTMVYVVVS
ncbi:hypothetical protein EMCRGX_G015307 [Ephydatia muelleri]